MTRADELHTGAIAEAIANGEMAGPKRPMTTPRRPKHRARISSRFERQAS